jgi:hypothetical protein
MVEVTGVEVAGEDPVERFVGDELAARVEDEANEEGEHEEEEKNRGRSGGNGGSFEGAGFHGVVSWSAARKRWA